MERGKRTTERQRKEKRTSSEDEIMLHQRIYAWREVNNNRRDSWYSWSSWGSWSLGGILEG